MTDNDWIKQLQSMMEHHEEPIPDDLWQDIESQLPERQAPQRVMPAWRRYTAAAAVALAVIVLGSLWYSGKDSSVSKPVIAQTASETITPASQSLAQPRDITPDADEHTASQQSAKTNPVKRLPTVIDANEYIAQAKTTTAEQSQAINSDQPQKQEEDAAEQESQQTTEKPDLSLLPSTPISSVTEGTTFTHPTKKRQPVSVGLFAYFKPKIQLGTGKMYEYLDFHLYQSTEPSLIDSMTVYPPRATHHKPYSLGVSVRVPITDRLAVISGLVYTRLKSNFSSRYSKEQTLYYLGVPLGATYSLWCYKRFSIYTIGGVQADFNIKATVKDKAHASDINIGKDRVQFSGMLGPGLQFDITKDFGIYVEPTARYYFNNGSDIENYFKDKPWNINLNAGLRLNLE